MEPDAQEVPVKPYDETQLTHKMRAFLKAYRACGHIANSAAAAKINKATHYQWLKDNADYKAGFDAADVEVCGLIEDEAVRRAVHGIRRPVIGQHGRQVFIPVFDAAGQPVLEEADADGKRQQKYEPLWELTYSDTLLTLLAKGRMPGRYRERSSVDNRFVDEHGKDRAGVLTLAELDKMRAEAE